MAKIGPRETKIKENEAKIGPAKRTFNNTKPKVGPAKRKFIFLLPFRSEGETSAHKCGTLFFVIVFCAPH